MFSTVFIIMATTAFIVSAQSPPHKNCAFAATYNDPSAFDCSNQDLDVSCGTLTGECPPQFCSQQCGGGLLLYYDCSMGNLPQCPPSGVANDAYPPNGYVAENPLGCEEDSFQTYISLSNGVSYANRQAQYKKWGLQTAIDAFKAYVNHNTTKPIESYIKLGSASYVEILKAYDNDARVRDFSHKGMSLLPDDYLPDTSAMEGPILRQGEGELTVKGFFDWVNAAVNWVGGAVKSAVKWIGGHPHDTQDIGCAVWDVFNFFVDFDASNCWAFIPPDYYISNTTTEGAGCFGNYNGGPCEQIGMDCGSCPQCSAPGWECQDGSCPQTYTASKAMTGPKGKKIVQASGPAIKYDPICLSECNTCLEYVVPGYPDIYCLWGDYKGNWPSDVYCLEECPSQTTRTLLGEAEKQTDCYELCNCANGHVDPC